jgi:hypothetical protein
VDQESYVKMDLPDRDGLKISRTDFVPDDHRAIFDLREEVCYSYSFVLYHAGEPNCDPGTLRERGFEPSLRLVLVNAGFNFVLSRNLPSRNNASSTCCYTSAQENTGDRRRKMS